MSFGSIAAYKGSTPTYKALIAAKYGKLDVSLKNIEMHKDNKTPEFLAKFPFGKVPAFTGADGYTIFESSAIAQYVAASGSAKDQLLGSDIKTQAQITQWVDSISNELQHSVVVWVYALLGYYPWNADAVSRAQTDVKRVLSVLDGVFLSRTFLVGDKVTLADISAVCALYHFYTVVLDPEHRAPYPNLNRWFETCINQPEFKAVLGEVKFCEKQPTKPQAKAAPKEASKPAKAAAPAKEAGDESPAAEKPKEKNPLDLLPKSSFVLDEWKRFYSNNDTRPTAINWFWDKFDPEGYSIWRVSYRYNSELTQTFMSSNLVGGFFQRLDRARKYAFGNLLVLGENNNNEIFGYFVIRGQDVPFEVSDTPDYPSFEFTKMTKDECKEEFDAVLAWEDVKGKKCADGKTFK